MDAQAIQQIQQDIVRAVAGNVADVMDGEWGNREWVHLFTDFEIDQQGGRSSNITFALARLSAQPLERISYRLLPETKQRFEELAEAMRRQGEDRWSTAQLRIERDGRFAFDFSYGQPWRLGGNLIDKRFEDYLDRWLDTPEGQTFTQAARQGRPSLRDRIRAIVARKT